MSDSVRVTPERALRLFKKSRNEHQKTRVANLAIKRLNAIPTMNLEAEGWFDIVERAYEESMERRAA
jgi:hypothetical protein